MVMAAKTITDIAKEVLKIEADSIIRLIDTIGEEFDKAVEILYNSKFHCKYSHYP